MELVLDAPVAADGGVEALGRERRAEQVIAGVRAGSAIDLAARGDLADGREARPVVILLEPGDVGRQAGGSDLDPAMALVGLRGAGQRGLGIVEKAPHVIVQRLLITPGLRRGRLLSAST